MFNSDAFAASGGSDAVTDHLYIACDLGAESGRVLTGRLNEGRLSVEEIHRFPTGAIRKEGSLRWDMASIWKEIQSGLQKAGGALPCGATASISVDSWGVDYVLMSQSQPLSWWPFHYRDERSGAFFQSARASASALIFHETGIQFLPFNTLYQLLAEREQSPASWRESDGFLLIADFFLWQLSGVAGVEISMASTTQLFNPREKDWSTPLQREFDLPARLFPPLVESGTVLGELRPSLEISTGLNAAQIIATCSHDTGAAVAAVPATERGRAGEDWAFLSSGTWSLLGVELAGPLINAEVQRAGFTNEAGYGGTTRFLKNIVGLWLVQECRRAWAEEGGEYSYDELHQLAREAPSFGPLIHPADARFQGTGAMPERIAEFCRETGQSVPQTPGETIRCVLESLALLYRQTLEQLETLTGRTIAHLHIVGGGSRNALLNELAAGATGREVWAGPVEATAIGNLLLQALALNHIADLAALRQTVAASFPVQLFQPENSSAWEETYQKFQQLKFTP